MDDARINEIAMLDQFEHQLDALIKAFLAEGAHPSTIAGYLNAEALALQAKEFSRA